MKHKPKQTVAALEKRLADETKRADEEHVSANRLRNDALAELKKAHAKNLDLDSELCRERKRAAEFAVEVLRAVGREAEADCKQCHPETHARAWPKLCAAHRAEVYLIERLR